MTTTLTSATTEFDEFYSSNLADVTALVCTITADTTDAQDIAQEAFCRAWQRWPDLSKYDNPGAWVRRVAVNLAHSRWRRLKAATAYLRRQRLTDIPPVDPEHIELLSELRAIPAAQRRAIVLHHLLDLPVGQVADEMGVGSNTVKSWLHRGRTTLASRLTGTPGAEIRKQAERSRTRNRIATAAAGVVVLLLIVGSVFLLNRPGTPTPPGTSPTPHPSTTMAPAPGTPIQRVAWAKATIAMTGACGSGQVKFTQRVGEWVAAEGDRPIALRPGSVVYADVFKQGDEALLEFRCNGKFAVGVVEMRGGQLHLTHWVSAPRALRHHSFWVSRMDSSRLLFLETRKVNPETELPAPIEGYRVTETGFDKIDAAKAYPHKLVPTSAKTQLELEAVAADLHCPVAPEPDALKPVFDAAGRFESGGLVLSIAQRATQSPFYVSLDLADYPFLLIEVACGTRAGKFFSNLIMFSQADSGWRALAVITNKDAARSTVYRWRVSGSIVTAVFGDENSEGPSQSFQWDAVNMWLVPVKDCGTLELSQGERSDQFKSGAKCLVDAVNTGALAMLRVTRPTVEGDPITTTYLSKTDGTTEVVTDSTQDKFGSGRTTVESCRNASLSNDEIQFTTCTIIG